MEEARIRQDDPRTIEPRLSDAQSEIEGGRRFSFGRNWARFLSVLDEERIGEAERSLRDMLERDSLRGLTFLDAGSGSGLFSLAARRMGAVVTSFDFDPKSVACTQCLKARYFTDDPGWHIFQGSLLDPELIASLGTFDIVYSWGVLHHTGDMWRAMELAGKLCRRETQLFISIYNDQGGASRRWRIVKRVYCSGWLGRSAVLTAFIPFRLFKGFLIDVIRFRNPLDRFRDYKRSRGMSLIWDTVDWLGGYPFEVAKPEQVFDFYRQKGFRLDRFVSNIGYGCNQFVFKRMME